MYLSLLFLLTSFFQQDDDWVLYHQDKRVEIYFKSHTCDDKKNGFSFEYYLIKVRNRTNETFVLNFFKGNQDNEEQKIALVLNPNELREGSCEHDPVKLRIFKRDNSQKNNNQADEFNLTKINVIEVN
tara:strand:+ start:258 stop:641 length:384 start_codon:yes stop_codon:yes gene_type:complete